MYMCVYIYIYIYTYIHIFISYYSMLYYTMPYYIVSQCITLHYMMYSTTLQYIIFTHHFQVMLCTLNPIYIYIYKTLKPELFRKLNPIILIHYPDLIVIFSSLSLSLYIYIYIYTHNDNNNDNIDNDNNNHNDNNIYYI